MIIEFKTQANVVFALDTEELTWVRWFNCSGPMRNKEGRGKLVCLPAPIAVGDKVTLMTKQWDGTVNIFTTTPVVAVQEYQLESPEVVETTEN